MDTLEVSTVVYLPPAEVYEFLLDFPGYADYSEHLKRVERADASDADEATGGPGAEYRLHFQWWKLSYVARSRVTDVDPPQAIDWTLTKDVDAHGKWLVDPVRAAADGDGVSELGSEESQADDAAPPAPDADASRIRFVVQYDSGSVHSGILDLPRFVPMDRIVAQITDLIVEEGKRVVERVVADLEGERRPVDLTVDYR